MATMQTSDVDHERLQRLARFEAPAGKRVLSLYLNLDPSANLGARENRNSAVNSLLDEAGRAVEGVEDVDHDGHIALRDDVSRAREELETNLAHGWAEGANALGIFVCGPADLFDVLRLPRPVPNRVLIADRPAIEPLAEVGPAEHWAVLLLDGDDARLLEGDGDRLEETARLKGDREGAPFIGRAAELLHRADEERPFARVFIGTQDRLYGPLCEQLPQQLRQRVLGRIDAGADWQSPAAVREKLEPLLQIDETRREQEALELSRTPKRGVRGVGETLPALYERRVGTLLLEPGMERPGFVCPRCRWASADELRECPVDGEEMREHPNVIEWAVEVAVEQDATVLPLRHHNDLVEHDGIAAVLRF